MAIILQGKSECSLCGNVIMAGDKIVGTSHFIADRNDPLWRFSDSAMHRSCFLTWDQREAFVAKFNQLVGGVTFGNGTYHQMESDGTIAALQRDEL
jgi:hypothetical protein